MTKQTHGPKSVKDPSRKFTKPEKSWILYDIGNSAFILMVPSTPPT